MSLEALLVPGLYAGHISSGLVTPGTAPVISSATVIDGGDSLQLVFDRDVVIGAGGANNFAASLSGGAATLTYSSGEGTNRLIYTWSRTIGDDETGTITYTQPGDGLEDKILFNDVLSFGPFDLVIGSELSHNDPTLVHKETNLYHEDRSLRHKRPSLAHNE